MSVSLLDQVRKNVTRAKLYGYSLESQNKKYSPINVCYNELYPTTFNPMNMRYKNVAFALVSLLILTSCTPQPLTSPQQPAEPVMCTMDAKQCPDGSFVGRQGPNCEFAACPDSSENDQEKWESYKDDTLSFHYPARSGSAYVSFQDWPPQVSIQESAVCDGEMHSLNNQNACVTLQSEGAAGSVYTTYQYQVEQPSGRMVVMKFTVRTPQCLNYPEPESDDCTRDQAAFRADQLAGQMLDTLLIN
ncbi:hypothetical protein IPJ72_06390 [Candidatus Peregrinibacteria bacterium]|nr:MAG: hypothetical protein IPJ72_06390 [Candidatus Peregrinibacteria bacterium]